MRPFIGDDTQDDEAFDETFQPHYPLPYILKTWYEYKEKGLYPRAGAYDDQDELLMQDWEWMGRAFAQIQEDYEDIKHPKFTGKALGKGKGFSLNEIRDMG